MDNNNEEGSLNNLNNLNNLTRSKRLVTVYIDRLLWEDFKLFSDLKHKSASRLLEEAMIEYMERHRETPHITINVIKPKQVNFNVATKLELKLVKQDLSGVLETLKRPGADRHYFLRRLRDLINKAIPLYQKTGDEELRRLLSRANEVI